MKKLKVAIVGCGYIANYHARGLQALPEVEIIAVVGLPAESVGAFAAKYHIPLAITDVS